MFLLGRSGILGVAVLGGVLYYSGAGDWLWQRIERLDSACYSGLAQMGAGSNISTPICGTLAQGIHAMDSAGSTIRRSLQDLIPNDPFGGVDASLNGLSQGIQSKIAALSSSSETLSEMMRSGPRMRRGGSLQEQFQTAVDSFTIGQHVLSSGGDSAQGVSWLEQGAAQPGGMGILSQLSLANLYGTGGHGVSADPTAASRYLSEANLSLARLQASGSVQSQEMLRALPLKPEELKRQIEKALTQIGSAAR